MLPDEIESAVIAFAVANPGAIKMLRDRDAIGIRARATLPSTELPGLDPAAVRDATGIVEGASPDGTVMVRFGPPGGGEEA